MEGRRHIGSGALSVPAKKPDGDWNDYRVRRLKDSSTRSMASGEIDFEGAYAEALGPVDKGFINMMLLVINTSRLYNAMGCSAHIQRAYLVARSYGNWREAFGQPIGRFPMVKESLAYLKTDAEACLAGTWLLAGLQERLEQGHANAQEKAFFRVALNLNKVQSAKVAHAAINRAIQVLGGNGAIESFSVLPRLLRDNVVYENWEGTHNVLLLQVLKDCKKMGLHEGFFAFLEERLGSKSVGAVRQNFLGLLDQPSAIATLNLHPIGEQMATLVQLAGLQMAGEQTLPTMRLVGRRYLAGSVVRDEAYLALLDACLGPPRAMTFGHDNRLSTKRMADKAPGKQSKERSQSVGSMTTSTMSLHHSGPVGALESKGDLDKQAQRIQSIRSAAYRGVELTEVRCFWLNRSALPESLKAGKVLAELLVCMRRLSSRKVSRFGFRRWSGVRGRNALLQVVSNFGERTGFQWSNRRHWPLGLLRRERWDMGGC